MPSARLAVCVLSLIAAGACARPDTPQAPPFEIVEATIPQMREAMEQGRLTSRQLVQMYLARIGMYQQTLKAAVYVNAHAVNDADERDRERAGGRVRGPWRGIPVELRGRRHTADMAHA